LFQTDIRDQAGSTAGAESNFIINWVPINENKGGQGSLIMWYQYQNTWTGNNTSEFMEKLGVISPVNGGVTGPASSSNFLQHFAWEQWSKDDRMRLMVGKLTTRVLLNLNRFAIPYIYGDF